MSSTQIHIPLGPFDHRAPNIYFNFAFHLPLKPGVRATEVFELLHEGLRRTFVQLPWLSGKLYPQSSDTPGWRPGQLEIRHDPVDISGPRPYQLKFNELNTSISYDELKESGFPTDAFNDKDLIWAPFLASISSSPEVFVAQANFVPGGCILIGGAFHTACDATSFFHILTLWSENCNALQKGSKQPSDLPPGSSDRDLPDRIWAEERTGNHVHDIDPKTWLLVGIDPMDVQESVQASNDHVDSRNQVKAASRSQRVLKAHMFYVSPSKFTALQKDCARELGSTSRVSGNDAICGLMWRSFMKARVKAAIASGARSNGDLVDVDATLHLVFDGRPNFSQALPPTYLGNFTFEAQPSLPLSSFISPDSSVATTAGTIRGVAGSIHSGNLLDTFTLLKNVDDFDQFARWKKKRHSSVDGGDMLITSLIMLPLESVCFGESVFRNRGVPEAFRPLVGDFFRTVRSNAILPRLRSGGVEFVANLFDDEFALLLEDEEFGKYAMSLEE